MILVRMAGCLSFGSGKTGPQGPQGESGTKETIIIVPEKQNWTYSEINNQPTHAYR